MVRYARKAGRQPLCWHPPLLAMRVVVSAELGGRIVPLFCLQSLGGFLECAAALGRRPMKNRSYHQEPFKLEDVKEALAGVGVEV